jgi:alcohol dehydrogenase (NADP+)
VTLLETWGMENLVDQGKCRAIGLSDVVLENLVPLYEAARIKPAVVQVESHSYHPQTELLEFCNQKGIVLLALRLWVMEYDLARLKIQQSWPSPGKPL